MAPLHWNTQKSELSNVRFVSIDLYKPYKEIAKVYFKNAIICAYSFHVLEHLIKDFRSVRLRRRRITQDENLQYLLTKFRYIFEHGRELDNKPQYNRRFRRYMNHRDMMTIFSTFLNLKNAEEKLADQISTFADSGIKEYTEFYNLLVNWSQEIINSFSIVGFKRINNIYIEFRNHQIEKQFFNANGYTNFRRTRNRILYCLN